MPREPEVKRAIVFFDGQSLFHAARERFGSRWPDYDPVKLARYLGGTYGWPPIEGRFFIHEPEGDSYWHGFGIRKLAQVRRQGVWVFRRPLRYRRRHVRLADAREDTYYAAKEKGIDVRIALDVIRLARERKDDVAVIFSLDQDLSEVAKEIRTIAREQERWIKIASAYPHDRDAPGGRGIDRTDWIRIPRDVYEACRDRRDYRPPKEGER